MSTNIDPESRDSLYEALGKTRDELDQAKTGMAWLVAHFIRDDRTKATPDPERWIKKALSYAEVWKAENIRLREENAKLQTLLAQFQMETGNPNK